MHRPDVHLVPARWRKDARAERRAQRACAPRPEPRELSGPLRVSKGAAQWLLAVIVVAASLAAFSESYRALILWATGHKLGGNWGVIFPAQVDTFILAGELGVFVCIIQGWSYRSRVTAWCVTAGGLAASIAWNVGHVVGGDWQSRATAAVPPLAAALALAVGLGILKRVIHGDGPAGAGAQPEPDATPLAAAAPVLPEEWPSLVAAEANRAVAERLGEALAGLQTVIRQEVAAALAAAAPKPVREPRPARKAPAAKRPVLPADAPLPGDPPPAAVRAASSARALLRDYPAIGRYRAARLVAAGSYALTDPAVNGHRVTEE